MVMDTTLLQNFVIALALGALIGLEREYARYKKRGHAFAGIRTFPLICLFGAVSAYLADLISVWILIASILLMGSLILVAYFFLNKRNAQHVGVTSEIAAFLTFLIGVLCYYQQINLAVSLSVIITIILYTRSMLHHFAENIQKRELADSLKFALIALVILPLLPNKEYGPFGLFNPSMIWLLVVLVSAIGFVGYILMKWLGERGLVFAGMLGGLASSTAVTQQFAQRSAHEGKISYALALAIIFATVFMFIRLMIEIALVNSSMMAVLLLPLGALLLLSCIFALLLWRMTHKSRQGSHTLEIDSPLTLTQALKFTLLLVFIFSLVKLSNIYLHTEGMYLLSFLSGLANVDAIAISLSQLAKEDLLMQTAGRGIMLAVVSNTLMKAGIVYMVASPKVKKVVLNYFAAIVLAALVMMAVV